MRGYFRQGKSIAWKASGGDKSLDLRSLANTKARCGESVDLASENSKAIPSRWAVTAEIALEAAPTAGNTIELYWAASHDNSVFPGGATGTDAAYKDSEEDEWKVQLTFIGSLVLTNDDEGASSSGDLAHHQVQQFLFYPPTRYGCPVVVNESGQALDDGSDHTLTLTALIDT